jgi:hypothetical protein
VGGRKRTGSSGHYCWVCGRSRPNEAFSGKGHRRHTCKDCTKLGPEALAYRQNVLALERCMTWEGFIPRKRRAAFERFLKHDDPRIRAMAETFQQADKTRREEARAAIDADEEAVELAALMFGADDPDWPFEDALERDPDLIGEDIPF